MDRGHSHAVVNALAASTEHRHFSGFSAQVIRTNRRKTIEIRVTAGTVSIVVPKTTSGARIDELLSAKRCWIEKKLKHQLSVAPLVQKQYVSGERFLYLGRRYRLKVEQGNLASVRLRQGQLMAVLPSGGDQSQQVCDALIDWYRCQAEKQLYERVRYYAPIVGATPTSITVKAYKSRWGSCSANGALKFNWHIILAPSHVVDYVVIHELCHLIHYNHSSKFWGEVARVLPDYERSRIWLRENGSQLRV